MGKVQRQLGLSCQRALYVAHQADPAKPVKVARWLEDEYPQIRSGAQQQGREIYSEDEARGRLDYHAGTTWAPKGQTPVVMSRD